ncbi:response regulator receiver domain-containing protein [Motilibacter rhizosphaerae]|uniref:Response regulator receiver domain-containing protein n=1 Tax=Motilibacter rhizosphaerae TaxID=598652 RepID=A0A4Q7NPD3_9ACTN|nr:response regulator [Motilibacter rhizosphaerae]RZS87121.1 response regulator receiver domain-containing protein [Motilibacter rhizosphaerae]
MPRPARVLVVDDSASVRDLISLNLSLEGFEVVTACNGREALDRVHDLAPDIVTLDVTMPDMDGFGTAERLRQDERTRELPIVIVSACAQESDFKRAEEIGVDAYVTKPFDPEDLVRIVLGLTDGGAERG